MHQPTTISQLSENQFFIFLENKSTVFTIGHAPFDLERGATDSVYSLRKLFTGFMIAALMLWKLTVTKAMTVDNAAAITNTHQ